MANKQELVQLTFRKDNGQIGYMSKGIPIPEFYDLIQPKQQNINVNVLIDFYPVIEAIHSLLSKNQNDDIYIKFNSLYSYWNDAKTYKKESIILSKSEKLVELSNELLSILKTKLKENPFHWEDTSYQRLEKINNFIEYVDIYIETILCFIHSKASLEIESFQQDKELNNYIKFLKEIITNEYHIAIGQSSQNNNPYDSTLLQYLLLIKSTKELENFLRLYGDKNITDFKIYLFDKLQVKHYYDNYNNKKYNANLEISSTYDDNYQIEIAILLRNTLFKILSISELLEKLKKGNVEWSSDNNHIKELESFLQKDKK